MKDYFYTQCVTSEGLTQGLEGAVLREVLFPCLPCRRRLNRCLPGFNWRHTELRAGALAGG